MDIKQLAHFYGVGIDRQRTLLSGDTLLLLSGDHLKIKRFIQAIDEETTFDNTLNLLRINCREKWKI